MYNPSNHIPLSKSLGPNAFPIDGKYMYFTNGANGVYSYRPFQSVAEVLDYFPLGSEFRGNPNGQPWGFEVFINDGGTLSSDGGSITGGINSVWWWRDGVLDADLIKKNESTPVTLVIDLEFTGNQVFDNSGNPYLLMELNGNQRPFSVIVNGKTITTGEFNISDNKLYSVFKPDGSAWSSADIIRVAVVGDASDFVPDVRVDNGSDSNVTYHIDASDFLLLPNDVDEFTPPVGSTISVDLISGQSCFYTIYNSDGTPYYEYNTVGPITLNGLPTTNNRSQSFIILQQS